jgi:hypothetical protein
MAIDDADYVKKTSSRYVFASFVITLNKDLENGNKGILKSLKVNNFRVVKNETGDVAFYSGMGKDNTFDYRKRKDFIIDKELSAKEVPLNDLMKIVGESAFDKGENASGYCGRLDLPVP